MSDIQRNYWSEMEGAWPRRGVVWRGGGVVCDVLVRW